MYKYRRQFGKHTLKIIEAGALVDELPNVNCADIVIASNDVINQAACNLEDILLNQVLTEPEPEYLTKYDSKASPGEITASEQDELSELVYDRVYKDFRVVILCKNIFEAVIMLSMCEHEDGIGFCYIVENEDISEGLIAYAEFVIENVVKLHRYLENEPKSDEYIPLRGLRVDAD